MAAHVVEPSFIVFKSVFHRAHPVALCCAP